MNKILPAILTSIFLTACGGGGDDTFSSSTISDIQGDWITDCITRDDGTSGIASYTFDTANSGNDFFVTSFSNFDTSNCSGDSVITVLGGDVIYRGEFATSVCLAEKIDLFVLSGGDDVNTYEGSELDSFLEDEDLADRDFDIACVTNERLFLGDNTDNLDGSSADRRPENMNMSIPFSRTNFAASRAVNGNQSNNVEAAMKRNVALLKAASQ